MDGRAIIAALFRYNDRANDIVFDAAAPLSESQLDRAFDMGRGT